MTLKRYILSSYKGFTLLELMVTTGMLVLISAMVGGAIVAQKKLYVAEVVRTKSNQDLRGIFNLVSSEIRLAGEKLPSTFPAILLTNGSNGAPDTLTIRRNILDTVLKLCSNLNNGTTTSNINFSLSRTTSNPTPPACVYNNNESNYQKWLEHYNDNSGGTQRAYVYKETDKSGQFFNFNGIVKTSSIYRLTGTGNTWNSSYSRNNSSIYLLEEWQLTIVDNKLRLINGQNTSEFLNLASDISDFQVQIEMQDGSVRNTFTTSQNWTDIANIQITIESEGTHSGKVIKRSASSKFFPRNILSLYGS